MNQKLKDTNINDYILTSEDVITELLPDSNNPVASKVVYNTIASISTDNDNFIPKKEGNSGEVIYRNGHSSYVNQRILDNSFLVCENQQDLDLCKNKKYEISFEDVYNNWPQFGNYNDLHYPTDSAYPLENSGIGVMGWQLSNNNMRIVQAVNTIDFCGYVSNDKFFNYEALVKFSSNNGDDDCIGFVAAAVPDASGRVHTISFVRSPNNQNSGTDICDKDYHWYCILDGVDGFNPSQSKYGQVCLAHGSLNKDNEEAGGWSRFKGTLVKVVRNANVFRATTTLFQAGTYEPAEADLGNELVIDIDQLIQDMPDIADTLRLFKNEQVAVGFCTMSIPYATFDVLKLNVLANTDFPIVNLVDGTVEQFNPETFTYDIVSHDIETKFKNGTMSFNKFTSKLFYSFGQNVVNITRDNALYDNYDLRTFNGLVKAVYNLLISLGVSKSNISI